MERLERARDAYVRRDWLAAREHFLAARERMALDADDLYALADSAWWLGMVEETLDVQQEAYRRFLGDARPRRAALSALEIAYTLALRDSPAQASGWIGRAARLLEAEPPCAEHGYLVYAQHEQAFDAYQLGRADDLAREVHAAGERFADPNLSALGIVGQGRVLIRRGDVPRGMALMDEGMVAAASDELEPGWAGNIYCHMMSVCHEIADWSRAGEWTEATRRWCEQMPGSGPFLGICRVHRIQTLGVLGKWEEAEREAGRVCSDTVRFSAATVAEAHYQLGELRRRRGDVDGAETAFAEAHSLGREPQAGMALLRMAQGRIPAARSAIVGALAVAPRDPLARSRLLPAAVEIAVAAGEVGEARSAADELAATAARFGTTALEATAGCAAAMVAVAAGAPDEATAAALRGLRAWRALGAPYEAARARLLLSTAHTLAGDGDAAALETRAAHRQLESLGVPPPAAEIAAGRLAGMSPASGRAPAARADGLTRREVQILALVATGRDNGQIADDLVLSVRTVERHVATIYRKLGLRGRSARAAAVGYALRHGLVEPTA